MFYEQVKLYTHTFKLCLFHDVAILCLHGSLRVLWFWHWKTHRDRGKHPAIKSRTCHHSVHQNSKLRAPSQPQPHPCLVIFPAQESESCHPVVAICLGLFLFRATTRDLSISAFPSELLHNFPLMRPLGEKRQAGLEKQRRQSKDLSLVLRSFPTNWKEEVPLKRIRKLPLENFLNGK